MATVVEAAAAAVAMAARQGGLRQMRGEGERAGGSRLLLLRRGPVVLNQRHFLLEHLYLLTNSKIVWFEQTPA